MIPREPNPSTDSPPQGDDGNADDVETGPAELEHEDERLDEELDETFPASDPIPYRHGG